MKLDRQNISRNPHPFEVTTFRLKTSNVRHIFRAKLETTIRAELMSDSSRTLADPMRTVYRKTEETRVSTEIEIDRTRPPYVKPIVTRPISEFQVCNFTSSICQ